jgi:hypothetical protein
MQPVKKRQQITVNVTNVDCLRIVYRYRTSPSHNDNLNKRRRTRSLVMCNVMKMMRNSSPPSPGGITGAIELSITFLTEFVKNQLTIERRLESNR